MSKCHQIRLPRSVIIAVFSLVFIISLTVRPFSSAADPHMAAGFDPSGRPESKQAFSPPAALEPLVSPGMIYGKTAREPAQPVRHPKSFSGWVQFFLRPNVAPAVFLACAFLHSSKPTCTRASLMATSIGGHAPPSTRV